MEGTWFAGIVSGSFDVVTSGLDLGSIGTSNLSVLGATRTWKQSNYQSKKIRIVSNHSKLCFYLHEGVGDKQQSTMKAIKQSSLGFCHSIGWMSLMDIHSAATIFMCSIPINRVDDNEMMSVTAAIERSKGESISNKHTRTLCSIFIANTFEGALIKFTLSLIQFIRNIDWVPLASAHSRTMRKWTLNTIGHGSTPAERKYNVEARFSLCEEMENSCTQNTHQRRRRWSCSLLFLHIPLTHTVHFIFHSISLARPFSLSFCISSRNLIYHNNGFIAQPELAEEAARWGMWMPASADERRATAHLISGERQSTPSMAI